MQLDLLPKEPPSVTQDKTPSLFSDIEPSAVETAEEEKAPGAFKTISEVSELLNVPQHVLRFWESRFTQIKPLKMRGGRRYYRPEDVDVLTRIKHLLYNQGYTIKGAKKAFSQTKEAPQPASKPPVVSKQEAAPRAGLDDKQHSQLSVIRQELVGLRDILKTHLEDQ